MNEFFFVCYLVSALCLLGATIVAVRPPRTGGPFGALLPFGLFAFVVPSLIVAFNTLGG